MASVEPCPSWTGLTLQPERPQLRQYEVRPEPEKPTRQYYSWEKREWTCEECGVKFVAQPTRKNGVAKPRRFCCDPCYRAWQRKQPIHPGGFQKGHVPANKGKKGLRLSPATEFKPGNIPQTYVPVGTVVERRDSGGRRRLQAYIKVGDPNVWKARSLIVWEEHNGPLPKGLILIHKDGDSLNDNIENLEAITRSENLARNRMRMDPKKRSKALKLAWAKRRNKEAALRHMTVARLKRLGYRYYCQVCGLPSKTENLPCHHKGGLAPL